MSHVEECEYLCAQLLVCSDEAVAGLLERISEIAISRGYFGLDGKIQSYLKSKDSKLVDLSLAKFCTEDDVFLKIWETANENPQDDLDQIYLKALRRALIMNEAIHRKEPHIHREGLRPAWLPNILSELIRDINAAEKQYDLHREQNKYDGQEHSSSLTFEELWARHESIKEKIYSLTRDFLLILENKFLSLETLGNLLTRRHEFSQIRSNLWIEALQTVTNRTTRIEFLDHYPAKEKQSVWEMLELGPREEGEIEPVLNFILSLNWTEKLLDFRGLAYASEDSFPRNSWHIVRPVSEAGLKKWLTKNSNDILYGYFRDEFLGSADIISFVIIAIFSIKREVSSSGDLIDRISRYAQSHSLTLLDMIRASNLDGAIFMTAAIYNQSIIFDAEKRALLEQLMMDTRRWHLFWHSLGEELIKKAYDKKIKELAEMNLNFQPNIGAAVKLAQESQNSKNLIDTLHHYFFGNRKTLSISGNLLEIARNIRRVKRRG